MSEEVTRRTLSIVLYNQHAGLQQNHATRTRTPLEPPVRATLIHRVTTLTSNTYTHTPTTKKKKLDATVVLEAQLLGERQQRDTTGR